MKKLMIAAAIVCAAAISHGAALNWGVNSITDSKDNKVSLGGTIAYFMDAATYDTFSGLTSDKVAAYCKDNYLYDATTQAGRGGATFEKSSGNYVYDPDPSKNPKVSGYIVLFDTADAADAKNYAYTAVDTKVTPSSGNIMFTKNFATDTAGWKEITNVPEPTSGLLLLIGVAGLALKRRRA